MKKFVFVSVLIWIIAMLPTAVLAHDGSARVVINQYAIAPGQPVEVSGINLGTDLEVQVMLVGESTAVLLGSVLCDGHGDFVQQFMLPLDSPEGIFAIQVIDTSVAGLSLVLAETRFKIDETAVSQPVNGPQVVAFTNLQIIWPKPLLLGLAGLVFFLFIWPTLIKRWYSKNNAVPRPQSQIQK